MVPGSFTVTSQIAVTLALACLVIGLVIVVGFMKHGIGFPETVRAACALGIC
jgi:F-type H+-transporting ATPase subunit a